MYVGETNVSISSCIIRTKMSDKELSTDSAPEGDSLYICHDLLVGRSSSNSGTTARLERLNFVEHYSQHLPSSFVAGSQNNSDQQLFDCDNSSLMECKLIYRVADEEKSEDTVRKVLSSEPSSSMEEICDEATLPSTEAIKAEVPDVDISTHEFSVNDSEQSDHNFFHHVTESQKVMDCYPMNCENNTFSEKKLYRFITTETSENKCVKTTTYNNEVMVPIANNAIKVEVQEDELSADCSFVSEDAYQLDETVSFVKPETYEYKLEKRVMVHDDMIPSKVNLSEPLIESNEIMSLARNPISHVEVISKTLNSQLQVLHECTSDQNSQYLYKTVMEGQHHREHDYVRPDPLTPRERELMNEINEMDMTVTKCRKKIRTLHQTIRRSKAKIGNLKGKILELSQGILLENNCDILKKACAVEILKHLNICAFNKTSEKTCSSEHASVL